VRWVLYKKGLLDQFEIVAPTAYGGLKSPEYLKLNPQGKMPLLIKPDGTTLPESEVIVQYLLDKFSGKGPSLVASTPEARAVGALATRLLDVYITPVQGCMYRKMDSAEQRAKEVQQIAFQLDAIEGVITGQPFICGADITAADGALFPTMVFLVHMLPKYFGWSSVFEGRPKLEAWWEAVQKDAEAAKVIAEIQGGLESWEKANRWVEQGIAYQVTQNPQLKWK